MHDSLHQLAQNNRLSTKKTQALWRLAGLHQPPSAIFSHVRMSLVILTALFLGAGIIFWIAANWDAQSRSFKLHVLQAAVAAGVIPSLFLHGRQYATVRTALLFFATVALGGLLAFIGMTYQTGADAWELFATWAALALIWIAMGRSDWLWAVWLCIAAAAIGLRSGQSMVGAWSHPSSWQELHIWVDFALWLGVFMLPMLLGRMGAVRSKQKNSIYLPVSQRLSAFLALSAWTTQALLFLIKPDYISYFVYIAAIALVVFIVVQGIEFDIVVLAVALLVANVLGLALLARWIFEQGFVRNLEFAYLLFSMCAAITVGGSVYWLYRQQQKENCHVE